jgi:hypothetical protein
MDEEKIKKKETELRRRQKREELRQEKLRQREEELRQMKIKEQIITCFKSKQLLQYIPHYLGDKTIHLNNVIDRMMMIMPNTNIEELKLIYTNLNAKYVELGTFPEKYDQSFKLFIKSNNGLPTSQQYDAFDASMYRNFITDKPIVFPDIGMSSSYLDQNLIHNILYEGFRNPTYGTIINIKNLISKIRELIECHILAMELIRPELTIPTRINSSPSSLFLDENRFQDSYLLPSELFDNLESPTDRRTVWTSSGHVDNGSVDIKASSTTGGKKRNTKHTKKKHKKTRQRRNKT